MNLVYIFSESPFQAAGWKLPGLSSESDGESIFQVTMQVGDLFFGSLHMEVISLTGHLAVIAGYFTICLLYDESIGQHGFADAFEQFVHVIVLGIDGLPVTYHVDVLLADDKFACIVQFGMWVAETEGVGGDVCVGTTRLFHFQVRVYHKRPAEVSCAVVYEV